MNDTSDSDGLQPDITTQGFQRVASSRSTGLRKLVVFLVTVTVVFVASRKFGDVLTLENLIQHEAELQQYYQERPLRVCIAAFLIYVAVTALSIPGATAMSLVVGWFFSFWRGLILVSLASTGGATLAFLLSRYFLRDAIQQKFGDRLTSFDAALEREGAYYLFTLRLFPAAPFFVINVVMGLTSIRVWTFWWVSQIGMLAGTCVYVYAGSRFPSLRQLAEHGIHGILTPELIVAFIVLGLFPICVKRIATHFRLLA